MANYVAPGGKYFETAWRKTPGYQGGFLLDGGVHTIAGMRLMLGAGGEKIATMSAFTAQLQEHLPPVDTLNAVVKTQNGVSGTLALSFGTRDKGGECVVACEEGTVTLMRGKVTVECTDGKVDGQTFESQGSGVTEEVKAWAEALENGVEDKMQSKEEALADLRVLEAGLRSGEQGGKPLDVEQ